MSMKNDEKREMKACKFVTGAKEEFKKKIERDTIDDIGITACTDKDGAFEITGSVSTTSPTGKLKTFGYSAVVSVDESGKCAFAALKVNEI